MEKKMEEEEKDKKEMEDEMEDEKEEEDDMEEEECLSLFEIHGVQ